jgi:uncharacterized protein
MNHALTITAVFLFILLGMQMLLSFRVAAYRAKTGQAIGDGGDRVLLTRMRQHGNLAENAPLFVFGVLMLELLNANRSALIAIAAAFIAFRLIHLYALSEGSMKNPLRAISALGTMLLGLGIAAYGLVMALPLAG